MLREDRIKFCRICSNQAFDADKGIICGLTGKLADFEGICSSYQEDEERKAKYESLKETKILSNRELSKGKRFANLVFDTLFVYFASTIGGFVYGFITSMTEQTDYYSEPTKFL